MTQKGSLFKGQKIKKSIPANRHGKITHIRKGKRAVKPSKMTKAMDADKGSGKLAAAQLIVSTKKSLRRLNNLSKTSQELSKFINYCNETKAATVANKDGGHLSIVKTHAESSSAKK